MVAATEAEPAGSAALGPDDPRPRQLVEDLGHVVRRDARLPRDVPGAARCGALVTREADGRAKRIFFGSG